MTSPQLTVFDVRPFLAFCGEQGIETRSHPGLWSTGYQVRYAGHWMGLVWNKHNKCYTVDKRLAPVFEEFKNAKGNTP